MKKYIAIMMIYILVFILVGCDKSNTLVQPELNEVVQEETNNDLQEINHENDVTENTDLNSTNSKRNDSEAEATEEVDQESDVTENADLNSTNSEGNDNETEEDTKEVDEVAEYWGLDEKYSYDENGMLHIEPVILQQINLDPEFIAEYYVEIEKYNELENERINGRDYASFTESELELYGKYERGENPWFVGEFCGWSCCAWFETYSASSVLQSDKDNKYGLENIYDGYVWTCWAEGVEGDGVGESIVMTANTEYIPRHIALYNGYSKSEETFYNNNRIKQLLFSVNGEEIAIFELEDTMHEQRFIIENLEETDENFTFTFEILSTYKGELYDDTCLSAIQIQDGHIRY